MTRPRKLPVSRAVHTILVAALAAAPAAAQIPWDRQVDERLRAVSTDLAPQGWRVAGDPFTGRLAQGGQDSLRVALRAGTRYALVAVCEADCRDLEVALLGETTTLVAQGTARSDRPVVEIEPGTTGKYRIVVTMARCATNRCGYAIGVFTR
jgi:hypothetical protein